MANADMSDLAGQVLDQMQNADQVTRLPFTLVKYVTARESSDTHVCTLRVDDSRPTPQFRLSVSSSGQYDIVVHDAERAADLFSQMFNNRLRGYEREVDVCVRHRDSRWDGDGLFAIHLHRLSAVQSDTADDMASAELDEGQVEDWIRRYLLAAA